MNAGRRSLRFAACLLAAWIGAASAQDIRVTLLKGREHYICLKRTDELWLKNSAQSRSKRADLWSYAAAEDGGATPDALDLTGGVVLVLGSEGSGIRPLVRQRCDGSVRIPMHGAIGSLNVSVAASLLLYEADRQRRLASA